MRITQLLVLLSALTAGCGGIEVVSHHDPSAAFDGYHTYAFAPITPDSDVPEDTTVNEFDGHVREILEGELAGEGLTPAAENPDLLIGWYADIHKKQAVRKVGQRYSYSYGWTQGQTRIYEYAEGTLKLEFADAESNAMVWTSTAKGSTKYDESAEERQARLRELIQRMLKDYPPTTAGQ